MFPLSHLELHPYFSGEGSKTGEGDPRLVVSVADKPVDAVLL